MPTGLWFEAVTPSGLTAWDDVNPDPIRRIDVDPVELDLAVGSKVVRARVGAFPASAAPVRIENQSVAYVTELYANAAGEIVAHPLSVGMTYMLVGPLPNVQATIVPVTVVDTRGESNLAITPSSPITLDLMTGGITLRARYGGKRISGVEVSGPRDGIVEIVDDESDPCGGIRIEPMAVGTTTITVSLSESYEYPLTVYG